MVRFYCHLAVSVVEYGSKDYEVPKKLKVIFLLFALIPFSSLIAAEKQVRVIADKAPIYAENNVHSYRVEIVYHSQRWKSMVTGFIQASMIEEILEKPQEEPKAEKITPKPKEEKVEPKPAEVPKKIEEEKEAREKEPPKISVEEKLVASSILPQKLFTLPESKEREIEPRIFMYLETRPPEPKPAKIKPKPEKITTQPEAKKKEEPPRPRNSLSSHSVSDMDPHSAVDWVDSSN